MSKYLILIISFILDITLMNFLPNSFQNITYFQPLFTVVALFYIYNLFNDDKKYFITIIVLAIVYGSLLFNNLLLGLFIFIIIGYIIKLFYRYITLNILTSILGVLIIITIYDTLLYIMLCLSFVLTFSVQLLWYKLIHSIIINLLYGCFMYYFCVKKSSKSII